MSYGVPATDIGIVPGGGPDARHAVSLDRARGGTDRP
jgi:hypothetical protein